MIVNIYGKRYIVAEDDRIEEVSCVHCGHKQLVQRKAWEFIGDLAKLITCKACKAKLA